MWVERSSGLKWTILESFRGVESIFEIFFYCLLFKGHVWEGLFLPLRWKRSWDFVMVLSRGIYLRFADGAFISIAKNEVVHFWVLNNFVIRPTNHPIAPSSGSLNWVAFQAFFDRSKHSFQSVLDFYRCFLRAANVSFLIQFLFRRGGLHICQQNCALIVQSDLDYWGLDDIHLQVLQPHSQKMPTKLDILEPNRIHS